VRIAFLLSGEHPSLPYHEVIAVLEAFGIKHNTLLKVDSACVVEMDASERLYRIFRERLAFTRSFGRLIGVIEPSKFPNALDELEPPYITSRFRATAIRIRGSCRELRTTYIERKIGEWILSSNKGAKVDLGNPKEEIICLITSGLLIIYKREGVVDRTLFKVKEVAARPFVHPASMRPTLARAMVNLARTRPGDLVLDPFVGVGGIALEILSVGGKLLGFDISDKMVVEAKNNLISYGFIEDYYITRGDALHLDLPAKVDRIVTDPPYGRMSQAVGTTPRELSEGFIRKVPEYLREGGWLAMAVPSDYLTEDDFVNVGLTPVQYFDIREHRSLIRRIWVARVGDNANKVLRH